jgi:Zn-dependent peptidase ImmA (M78 family)
MPADEFRNAFAESNGDLFELAEKFGVSAEAAKVRAQFFNLV